MKGKRIQIVIEIPAEVLKTRYYTDYFGCGSHKLTETLDNAIPLPEHGDLIDVNNIQEIQLEDSLTILTHKKGDEVDWHIDAPTILEANK